VRIIDISQGWREGMPRFEAGWYPEFKLERVMTPQSDPALAGRTFSKFELFPHNASHVESSLHFDEGGEEIAAVPLETVVGLACVADLSHLRDHDAVTGQALDAAAGAHWQPRRRLLIRTDHPRRRLGSLDYWTTAPYLEPSAADWIVENDVALLGLDCITDRPGDETFPVHRRILEAGIPILENVANLHELSQPVVWLAAQPIKIHGAEAAPARPVAIEGFETYFEV
jgi:arylformamidase